MDEQLELYKVSFVEGEDVCRINGVLATNQNIYDWCGAFLDTLHFYEQFIVDEHQCKIYLKSTATLDDVVKTMGQYYPKEKEYDIISNSGYGSISAMTRKSILGKGDVVIYQMGNGPFNFRDYKQFSVDYFNFNRKEYDKLMASLDYYYENQLYLND